MKKASAAMVDIQDNMFHISKFTTMNNNTEFSKQVALENAAADACIAVYKDAGTVSEMTKAVETYLAFMVAPLTEKDGETFLEHRKMAAERIPINCLFYLNREQLASLDRNLGRIWKNPPKKQVEVEKPVIRRKKRGRGI